MVPADVLTPFAATANTPVEQRWAGSVVDVLVEVDVELEDELEDELGGADELVVDVEVVVPMAWGRGADEHAATTSPPPNTNTSAATARWSRLMGTVPAASSPPPRARVQG